MQPAGRASRIRPRGDAATAHLFAVVSVARRTAKQSPPEKTRCSVLPSALIHLVGKLHVSPGLTSHAGTEQTVVHGPHGSGASKTPKPDLTRASAPAWHSR